MSDPVRPRPEASEAIALATAISALVEQWQQAAMGGKKASIGLHEAQAYEDARYELGKADARRFCAESLAALLAAHTEQPR